MISYKTLRATILAGVAALTVSAAANAQSTFVFNQNTSGAPSGYTLYNTFETTAERALVTGTGYTYYNTTIDGVSVAPPGDTTYYLSVGGNGTATLDFSGFDVRSFAFDYGSVDSYNLLTINYANGTTQAFTGSQILSGLPDHTTSGSITVNGNGTLISSVTLSTSQNAFEVDNLSYSNALSLVPEAATWGMMVVGFGLMGAAMRRKRSDVSFAA